MTAQPPDRHTVRAAHATIAVFDGQATVNVSIRGEYDLASAPASEEVIEHVGELLGDEMRTRITVDMSGVSFFDASGINFLLRLERLAQLGSATMSVHVVDTNLRRLLGIVGLERMLGP